MVYLILAIVCGTACNVLFKIFHKYDLDIKQIVLFNYITAVLINWIPISYNVAVDSSVLWQGYVLSPMVYLLAIIVGGFFMSAFIVMGKATSYCGVSRATVAARASLVLPIVLSWLFLGQPAPDVLPVVLVILALCCIVSSNRSKITDVMASNSTAVLNKKRRSALILLGVFLFYGICDFALKLLQHSVAEQCHDDALVECKLTSLTAVIFLMAAILSFVTCLTSRSFRKRHVELRTIVGGVGLGVLNAGCAAFVLRGLSELSTDVLYLIYNTSVVLLVALSGMCFFSERLNKIQILGIFLAAIAFVLLFIK